MYPENLRASGVVVLLKREENVAHATEVTQVKQRDSHGVAGKRRRRAATVYTEHREQLV